SPAWRSSSTGCRCSSAPARSTSTSTTSSASRSSRAERRTCTATTRWPVRSSSRRNAAPASEGCASTPTGVPSGTAATRCTPDTRAARLQCAERERAGYYFLSSSRARTWSGNRQYALDDDSELALGFERWARFRDREGSVTGVTAARTDPRGRNEGRGYTRNFDVDLTRWNLRWSRDLDERSNLLAVVYEYRDETTYWSAPMRFDASGRPTTNVLDYSTLNDYR